MTQAKTFKQKLWKSLKTFYWKHISTIDSLWTCYGIIEQDLMYLPSFFKIHTPEEAKKIMEENRKLLYAELEALGEWEESWKTESAGKVQEETNN